MLDWSFRYLPKKCTFEAMIGSPRGQFTHDLLSDNRFLIDQHLHEKAGINNIYLHLFLPKSVNIRAKRHGILALSNFPAGS